MFKRSITISEFTWIYFCIPRLWISIAIVKSPVYDVYDIYRLFWFKCLTYVTSPQDIYLFSEFCVEVPHLG